MTTKNCANGPKLVLKDLYEMSGYHSIALYITNIKSKFKWLNNKTEINKPRKD